MNESSYRGKVKEVQIVDDQHVRIIFTDEITAGDGAKKDELSGKGKINLEMTILLMSILEEAGVPTHLVKQENENTILARKLSIFPIEVVVRNTAAGSYSRRYGVEEATDLPQPVVEYFVKDDELHDPLIDGQVAINRGFITQQELDFLRVRALQVNNTLYKYFDQCGMLLVDFKLEFGKDASGSIYLGDEISPDSMRVWDKQTREKLDKDRFRKDLGDVLAGYRAILDRLEQVEFKPQKEPLVVEVEIKPKPNISNPSGDVVRRTLTNAGLDNLESVKVGKLIQITINDPSGHEWFANLDKAVKSILTNPLIETYSYRFKWVK